MNDICPGCGTTLTDCGPVGVACLNKSCTYEMDAALKWLRQQNEAKDRAELARLKEKYEAPNDAP